MPVRSSTSSVLRWPDREAVIAAARRYAASLVAACPEVERVALFGSYAADRAGPGSDADILVELSASDRPIAERPLGLPPPRLPVPVDLLVMTTDEIRREREASPRWAAEVHDRALLLAARGEGDEDAQP